MASQTAYGTSAQISAAIPLRRTRTRCNLEPFTIPCPARGAGQPEPPGLRTASGANRRRGGILPSRACRHHVQRKTNEPQKQACFCAGRGQIHRGVGERQPRSRADGPAPGQRCLSGNAHLRYCHLKFDAHRRYHGRSRPRPNEELSPVGRVDFRRKCHAERGHQPKAKEREREWRSGVAPRELMKDSARERNNRRQRVAATDATVGAG